MTEIQKCIKGLIASINPKFEELKEEFIKEIRYEIDVSGGKAAEIEAEIEDMHYHMGNVKKILNKRLKKELCVAEKFMRQSIKVRVA